jgi:hypothetical protein
VDAKKASYGVENATYAVVQLAQTTMRSELGKITLDKTFEERATLNLNIVESIRFVSILHSASQHVLGSFFIWSCMASATNVGQAMHTYRASWSSCPILLCDMLILP